MVTLLGLLLAFAGLIAGAVYLATVGIQQRNMPVFHEECWNEAEQDGSAWNQTEHAGILQTPENSQYWPSEIPQAQDAWTGSIEFDKRVTAALAAVPNAVIGPDLHTTLALNDTPEMRKLQVEALLASTCV